MVEETSPIPRTESNLWATPGTSGVPQGNTWGPSVPGTHGDTLLGKWGPRGSDKIPRTAPQGRQKEPPTPGMWGPLGTRQDPGQEGTCRTDTPDFKGRRCPQ